MRGRGQHVELRAMLTGHVQLLNKLSYKLISQNGLPRNTTTQVQTHDVQQKHWQQPHKRLT
eukprot:5828231-Amphidinium_carterae.1